MSSEVVLAADALGPSTVIPLEGEAKSPTVTALRWVWRISVGVLCALICGLAVLVARGDLYEPGSDFGYYLGLTGGLLMLSQMVYSLRKRFPSWARVGAMETWFKYHMIIGMLGPLLILFHTSFTLGSDNGRYAFYSMLAVAISGMIGRYVYRQVHRGLYGRQITLGDVTADLKSTMEQVGSIFSLRADIEPRLMAFYRDAFATDIGVIKKVWRFVTLGLRSRRLAMAIRTDAKRSLRRRRREQNLSRAEVILNYKLAKQQIDDFLHAVVQASRFSFFEKVFSMWHLVHIPFLYLLIFSGTVHVIAVHMY